MSESLLKVLMERDGMSEADAREEIEDAKIELNSLLEDGEIPYDYCMDRWGLEPDYLEELLF
ncbi:MAG: hypothetical protein PF569_03905 [Candidatus Woesearchaeota archaeon]|jgi:hypothetical protein|nr:hypothetical protein [Candidatus Woesearchaeota archaeon]